MTKENKEILIKRLKSLAWRLGMLIAVSVVAFLSSNLELFNLPVWAIPVVSLILSEITKFLNSRGG